MDLLLPSFRSCYFCGTENRTGFGIRYSVAADRGEVRGEVRPAPAYCGYPGVLHGGLQSAFLDDAMYWAVAWHTGLSSATVELACSYLAPARLGDPFQLRAGVETAQGRKVHTVGTLTDARGVVVVEAKALYILHRPEEFRRKILPWFDFTGCGPKVVERFRAPDEPPPPTPSGPH